MTSVRYDVDGTGVATIALDQPETRNALSDELLADLIAALESARDDDAVRCVVLTSTHEKIFSSGGNLGGFADDLALVHKHFATERFPRVFRLLGELGKPSICAANGHVLAGALGLALACDLIVATPGARFGLVEKVVGLTPSMGGTQRLAERAGSGRARQFVMRGDLFDAVELERWGVVNEIYPEEEFAALSRALADELAAGPTKAHAMTKRILRRFREGGIPAADEAVRTEAAELFATEDLQNAVRTFLEHGGPGHAEFNGR
jgi:enoyl-CoA hydratase